MAIETEPVIGLDMGHGWFMTAQAIRLDDPLGDRFSVNGLDILKGKCKGVGISVSRFNIVFSNQVVGDMTIVTGDGAVGPYPPGFILFTHDMAIDTGFRVIRQVGIPARIDEGIPADSDKNPG